MPPPSWSWSRSRSQSLGQSIPEPEPDGCLLPQTPNGRILPERGKSPVIATTSENKEQDEQQEIRASREMADRLDGHTLQRQLAPGSKTQEPKRPQLEDHGAGMYIRWHRLDSWVDDAEAYRLMYTSKDDPEVVIGAASMMRKQRVAVNLKKLTGAGQKNIRAAVMKDIDTWCRHDAHRIIQQHDFRTMRRTTWILDGS